MGNDVMRFGSALTFERDAASAAVDLAGQAEAGIGGERPDLVLLFHTVDYAEVIDKVLEALASELPAAARIGCMGEGVIGNKREVEREPAIAMVAARMPGVAITPFALMPGELKLPPHDPSSLGGAVDFDPETRLILMLADPFSTPMGSLLDAFNRTFEGVPIVGGMSSGTSGPGTGTLILGDRVYRQGAVGLLLSGALQADFIVSQGCRPVGPVLSVTAAEGNMIGGLESETPVLVLQRIVDTLDEDDRELMSNGLFVGRAIDPSKAVLGRGDFLIRGVMGIDRETGAIAIGDLVQPGERIQFHVRDAGTATEDLEMLLTPHSLFGNPCGAFLFSCNGRGTRLYDRPDGDVTTIDECFHDLPLAGFFCAGEIGPVGGRNFLHGHTASMALIRPLSTEDATSSG